jgi:hypothetical protein
MRKQKFKLFLILLITGSSIILLTLALTLFLL